MRYAIPISDISKDDESKRNEDGQGRKYTPFKTEYQLQFKQYSLFKESHFQPRDVTVSSEHQQKDEESKYRSSVCTKLFVYIKVEHFLLDLPVFRTISLLQ